MAITDSNDSQPSPQPVPQPVSGLAPLPLAALDRLPLLHDENAGNAELARFLAGAVHAAGALTLLGMAVLVFDAGTTLKSCFAWAFLVLIGVGALLRSYIRSTAAVFDRAPLNEAAQDMRAILLYAGFAWGAGAFLVLPPVAGPVATLAFAGLPSLALALVLRDQGGPLAFLIPVTILSLTAAVLQPWSDAGLDTALLLMLQSSIAARIILHNRHPRSGLPAGLLLR
jgi:hypothetical protein